jgi:hypothetical protein
MTYYSCQDRRKNGLEGVDFITCKICGIKKDVLKRHIKIHSITWEQYLELFPNSVPTSEIYKKTLSKVRTGSKNGMFGSCRRGKENPFFGKKHTEKTRKKVSESRKGKYAKEEHWLYKKGYLISGEKNPNYGPNENLKGEKNPFYGKTHTEETKEKLRNHPNIVTKGFLGHKHTIINKAKSSMRMTSQKKYVSTISGRHCGIYFDSSYECIFLEICKKLNLKVERSTKFRSSYFFKGKRRLYTPDFYLPHLNLVVEIKGLETEQDKCKQKQFAKKHFYIKYAVIKGNDLKLLISQLNISSNINTFEGVTFNNEDKVKKRSAFL